MQGRKRARDVEPVAAFQADRGACRKLRFEEAGYQFRLDHEAPFPLKDEAVAEGVQKQDPRHEDEDRKEVERDDLAGKRGPVHGDHATFVPLGPCLAFRRRVRTDPVLAQYDVGVFGRLCAHQVHPR